MTLPTYTRAAAHLAFVLGRAGPRLDRVAVWLLPWSPAQRPSDADFLADALCDAAAARLARVRARCHRDRRDAVKPAAAKW
jgi:hypothetical protein